MDKSGASSHGNSSSNNVSLEVESVQEVGLTHKEDDTVFIQFETVHNYLNNSIIHGHFFMVIIASLPRAACFLPPNSD